MLDAVLRVGHRWPVVVGRGAEVQDAGVHCVHVVAVRPHLDRPVPRVFPEVGVEFAVVERVGLAVEFERLLWHIRGPRRGLLRLAYRAAHGLAAHGSADWLDGLAVHHHVRGVPEAILFKGRRPVADRHPQGERLQCLAVEPRSRRARRSAGPVAGIARVERSDLVQEPEASAAVDLELVQPA